MALLMFLIWILLSNTFRLHIQIDGKRNVIEIYLYKFNSSFNFENNILLQGRFCQTVTLNVHITWPRYSIFYSLYLLFNTFNLQQCNHEKLLIMIPRNATCPMNIVWSRRCRSSLKFYWTLHTLKPRSTRSFILCFFITVLFFLLFKNCLMK